MAHQFNATLMALVAILMVELSNPDSAQSADETRTGFEESTINEKFVPCHRPENTIEISKEKARSGKQSLLLRVNQTPLFPYDLRLYKWSPSAESCLMDTHLELYRNDDAERAELWENKDFSPAFGTEAWYGFSMWIERNSAPYGDFNRAVLGQWKANYPKDSPVVYSPFLSQRLTGGFYHITLDVDAKQAANDDGKAKTCKILLAFMAGPASPVDGELSLDRPAMCETRLEHSSYDLVPVEDIKIERYGYLPDPFDHWTDVIFGIQGGKDGFAEVWANGKLIAKANGWIGHKAALNKTQYFKFGPYRDPAAYGFTSYIDNLARGNSKAFVDPAQ